MNPSPLFSLKIFFALSLIFLHCNKDREEGKIITIAGSTSVQPFAEKLAEEYMKINHEVLINVHGGGSSTGIQAAWSGAADIGTSSRELVGEEKKLHTFVIAKDGLAIIVHPQNRVDNLSREEIRRIFSGGIRNWKEVGGEKGSITVITREEGSGTRNAFEELVMKGNFISDAALVQDSNGAVREVVANDPNAIGYISYGLLEKRVKALKIDGVEPNFNNILQKKYVLERPFLFVTKDEPQGHIKEFINFVLSSPGQKILQKEGLIPVGKGR